jgi:hypothetical protein
MSPSSYPAAVATILNTLVAALVSFNFLSATAAHAIVVAVVAATSLGVVFLVHPFAVSAMTGAFQTFLVALGGFGFHLSDEKIAALVAVVGLIAGYIVHRNATPLVAFRKGTTVEALAAAPYKTAASA